MTPPVVAAAFLAACAAFMDFGLGCFPLSFLLAVCFILAIFSFSIGCDCLDGSFLNGEQANENFVSSFLIGAALFIDWIIP